VSNVQPLTMYQRERNYLAQERKRGGNSCRVTNRQLRRMLKKNWQAAARAARAEGEWSA